MGTASLRVIGMLGGMSWESSAEYYRLVNEVVRERLGGLHSARCVLVSVDFADIEELQASGRWEQAGKVLAAEAASRAGRGRRGAAALHQHHAQGRRPDRGRDRHPVAAHRGRRRRRRSRDAGVHIVGLLGTAFTMEQDFYRRSTRRAADSTCSSRHLPTGPRCTGSSMTSSAWASSGTSHARCTGRSSIIWWRPGREGIILGCTEIELLITAGDSPVPVFPTTRLHVEAAVDLALARH